MTKVAGGRFWLCACVPEVPLGAVWRYSGGSASPCRVKIDRSDPSAGHDLEWAADYLRFFTRFETSRASADPRENPCSTNSKV